MAMLGIKGKQVLLLNKNHFPGNKKFIEKGGGCEEGEYDF